MNKHDLVLAMIAQRNAYLRAAEAIDSAIAAMDIATPNAKSAENPATVTGALFEGKDATAQS